MKKYSFVLISLFFLTFSAFAQKEKGKIMKTPSIFSKEKSQSDIKTQNFNQPKDQIEFQFEEETRLRFSNSYESSTVKEVSPMVDSNTGDGIKIIKVEPIRDVNRLVQDDTSSIDEGDLQIVEIEEMAQFEGSDDMVQIASYYSIWDTRNVDPYGINPLEFEEVIPIKLYDLTQGRYWSAPLENCPITSHFGWRSRRWHKGTDLDLETGDPVFAAFDGIVRVAGYHSGWGNTMLIRHYNGLETLYGHLSKIYLEPNTIVKAGDKIALGGNTGRSSGSHLHFEVSYEGNQFDSENVFTYNKEEGKSELKSQEFLLTPDLYNYLRGGRSKPVTIQADDTTISADEEEFEEEEEVPTKVVNYVWVTVRRGDTLSEIAARNKTSVDEICKINKIRPYHRLYPGMRLRIK